MLKKLKKHNLEICRLADECENLEENIEVNIYEIIDILVSINKEKVFNSEYWDGTDEQKKVANS